MQDALEAALAGIAGTPVSTTAAGRTDRGVHARIQVVHFDTAASRPPSAWVRGVNALLPDAVAVLWSQPVPEDFHARYSARSRTYRYELLNRPVRAALAARYAGWFHAPLDLDKMRSAAALDELRLAYERARKDPAFEAEFRYELKHYVGRPSPIYHAKRLSERCGGAQIYIKREDLNHTGAHKINNTIGQALLARRMGKPRVIAETGAGMHLSLIHI